VTVTADGKPKMNIEYTLSKDKSEVTFSASLLSDEDVARGAYLGVGLSAAGKMGTPEEPSDIFVCYSGYGRQNVLSRHWVKGYELNQGVDWPGTCVVADGVMAWTMPVKKQNDQQRSIILSDDGPSMNNLIWAIGIEPTGYHGNVNRGTVEIDITGATRQ